MEISWEKKGVFLDRGALEIQFDGGLCRPTANAQACPSDFGA